MLSEAQVERQPGEKMSDYLGRFSGKLAEASLIARDRGDDVRAIFFAIKAAETLQLAKALGFDPAGRRALKEQADG